MYKNVEKLIKTKQQKCENLNFYCEKLEAKTMKKRDKMGKKAETLGERMARGGGQS